MVICFDATKEAKRSLDALIQTGQFKDTSEAISMALMNYEVLQRAATENSEVVHADVTPAVKSPTQSAQPSVADPSPAERVSAPGLQMPQQIPSLFQLPKTRLNDED